MKTRIKCALGLVVVPAIVALVAGPAQAAGGTYDVTHSSGDIAGAWAHGTFWKTSDGRWHLNGELKDTASDGKGAALKIVAIYADNGTRYEEVKNANGNQAVVNIGEYNFASSLRYIQLQECTMTKNSQGVPYISACANGSFTFAAV
ncbi:hypothetical protein OG730_00730 [Streptomyces sp. NBC_01298]|uniref:hypothetical protein n=1 Tax=Streptomyces sp. NBC_01298 TaxID=2903817 RepID=UPI002E0EE30C|nr:hypothetical protein OG730_00730 [Streptomyces sp. NBC_01298]